MTKSFVLTLLLNIIRSEEDFYNILSIDGGGIRGIIPAIVIKNMEEFGYSYATEKGYDFPKYAAHKDRFLMTDLFNMTAGTSTGSIIAAGLTCPMDKDTDPTPKFNSTTLLDLYTTKGNQIFVKKTLGPTMSFIIGIFIVLGFAIFGFALGNHIYDNPEVEISFLEMEQAISDLKRRNKGEKYKPRDRNRELVDIVHKSFIQKIIGCFSYFWAGICNCMFQLWRSIRNCLGYEEGEDMSVEQPKSYTIQEQLLQKDQIVKDTATEKMKIHMQQIMIKDNLNMLIREKFNKDSNDLIKQM